MANEPITLNDLLAQVGTAEQLDDEALASLTEDIRTAATEALAGDITDEVLAEAQAAAEAIASLTAVADARAQEAQARADRAAELLSQLNGETDEPEAEGDEPEATDDESTEADEPEAEVVELEQPAPEAEADEEVAEPEAEKVAASSVPAPAPAPAPKRVSRVAPRSPDMAPRKRQLAASSNSNLVLRASANVPGITAGEVLDTPERIGRAFGEALKASAGYRGPRVNVPVATIGAPFDPQDVFGEERTLDQNTRSNMRKVEAVCSPQAIRASGGQCAPTPVDYTQPIIGTDDRPVRDVLARFGADRGGVRLIPPPSLSTVSTAIDTWTHATDVTPGGDTKNCLTMTCPSDVETFVDAITTCIKVGNFRQMYWPEQVDAWVKKAAMAAARTAEEALLTQVGAGSKNISATGGLGSTRDILAVLDHTAASLRNRQRTPRDFPLRLIAPAWMLDNMRADLTRQGPGDSGANIERLATADAEIEAFFRQRNVNVQWALDGETGQEFAAQSDGAIVAWPSHAVVYLYVEGEWLHLDGGQLNLGVIRDSTLVGTNDFIMFSEFMEHAAFHGTESDRIDIDICPSGKSQGTASYDPCTLGS